MDLRALESLSVRRNKMGETGFFSAQPPAGGRMILERNLRGFDRLCASCGSQDPADTEASMLESQPGPESAMIDW